MMWYRPYCFEVTVHQTLKDLLLVKDSLDMMSFPAITSYSFHRICLKLNGQLDHEVEQVVLFRGYSILICDRVITIFKDFPDMTWFLDKSSNSFH